MDFIRHDCCAGELKKIFEEVRSVDDAYMSKKIRKSKKLAFGFIRYKKLKDAEFAIEKLNGFFVRGSKLKVSMARYNKGGHAFTRKPGAYVHPPSKRREIKNPAFRDSRNYRDVLFGRKQRQSVEEKMENFIPVLFTLNVNENVDLVEQLKLAVIVENADVLDMSKTASLIAASRAPIKGMFSLLLTKLVLLFDSDCEVENAVNVESVLWKIFDDVRRLSEGEYYADRLVWIDCYGINPKCWSIDTVRRIGENWGPVICIDEPINGIQSRSHARLLVRTKA